MEADRTHRKPLPRKSSSSRAQEWPLRARERPFSREGGPPGAREGLPSQVLAIPSPEWPFLRPEWPRRDVLVLRGPRMPIFLVRSAGAAVAHRTSCDTSSSPQLLETRMRSTLHLADGVLKWTARTGDAPDRRPVCENAETRLRGWAEVYRRSLLRPDPWDDLVRLGVDMSSNSVCRIGCSASEQVTRTRRTRLDLGWQRSVEVIQDADTALPAARLSQLRGLLLIGHERGRPGLPPCNRSGLRYHLVASPQPSDLEGDPRWP